jgi:hypothetical protein
MSKRLNVYIENLYNSCMWVTDQHRQLLYKRQKENNLSDEEIQSLVEKNAETAKRNFSKVFKRMGNKIEYYTVPTCIFPIGEASEIVISCKYGYQKIVGRYKVIVSPFYNYDYKASASYKPYSIIIEAKNNSLIIPFLFDGEDMYSINVFYLLDEEEMLFVSTNVYAVNRDLYECKYYKADLHMHTTHSDGYEPPELVVASARECGMDIIAITDHNAFSGSVSAKKKAADMGLDMTVILGEEYSLEYSPMHILALGTEEEIDRRYLTKQVLDMPETKKILESNPTLSCDAEVYACTQVLLDQVSKIGGISILAHPYWKPIALNGTRIDTPENVYIELGKDKKFTGIEIVSGSLDGEVNVSNLQASLARTILGNFDGVPIIGITDAHYYTTDSICGKHFTIVFSKSNSKDCVLEALRSGFTVAVELVNGTPLCYGEHRLVKFAEFLLKNYFPSRDLTAKKEALSAKQKYLLKSAE